MDPNSLNQLWSKWTFDVREMGRRVPRADVELNAARWMRQGFGSVAAMRLVRRPRGWRIEVIVEGKPAHDPRYVAHVEREFCGRFVAGGWGPLAALGAVKARVIAGSKQDGTPREQWVGIPTIIETVG